MTASMSLRIRRGVRKLEWALRRGGPGRPPRDLTVPTENGLLTFSNMDLHNARILYVQRAWEIGLIRRSVEYLKREGRIGRPGAEMIVDVGANIGMICIAMLRHGYFREALAFEPDATNFAYLERNIAQNGMSERIRAFRCALTESDGAVELELSGANYGDHRVRGPRTGGPALMGEEERSVERVPARSLDRLVREEGIDPARIGLLWVDTQGHEGHFLRGARATLSHGMPVLSEFWPYGIVRSGLDRDSYAEIIRSLFTRLVLVDADAGRFEPRPVSEIAGLFDSHPRPEQHLEVIYIPK
jgi:FkbM family methyltransferase